MNRVESRASGGGLRFGEMERDNFLASGSSYFLKDRLFENSDKYKMFVCEICGNTSIQNADVNGNTSSTNVYCKSCKNSVNYSIQIPFATKLLFQELAAMLIIPRIICKD